MSTGKSFSQENTVMHIAWDEVGDDDYDHDENAHDDNDRMKRRYAPAGI